MKIPGFSELIIFSRTIGAALLVCGWLVAGLIFGRWFISKGFPGWSFPLALIGGVLCALLAGWREVRSILAMIHREDKKIS